MKRSDGHTKINPTGALRRRLLDVVLSTFGGGSLGCRYRHDVASYVIGTPHAE